MSQQTTLVTRSSPPLAPPEDQELSSSSVFVSTAWLIMPCGHSCIGVSFSMPLPFRSLLWDFLAISPTIHMIQMVGEIARKLKAELNNHGNLGALVQHELSLRPKLYLTISGAFDTRALEKTPKFGLGLSLKP
ncbi:hypothetical protein V6N13_049170 [Hibiscus sabdariffa]